ncbi:hypothetical protein [Vibrio azureus]|nr:hypothetical protein [Vibrio azureus]
MFFITLIGCNKNESFNDNNGSNNDGSVTPELVSISLVLEGDNKIPVGLNGYVKALATFSDNTVENVSADVQWHSSNNAFTPNGLTNVAHQRFKAHQQENNQADIHATLGSIRSDNVITLFVSEAVVEAINITPPTMSIPAGLEGQFYVHASLSDHRILDLTSETEVVWTADKQPVDYGRVSPSEEQIGNSLLIQANLDIHGKNLESQSTLYVSDLSVQNIRIELLDGEVWNNELAASEAREIAAIAIMSDGTEERLSNEKVDWSTSNDAISLLRDNARVFVVGQQGDRAAEVLANMANLQAVEPFYVYKQRDPVGVVLATEETLRKGESMSLRFVAKGSDGVLAELTHSPSTIWSLSDTTYGHMEGNKLVAIPPEGYQNDLSYPESLTVTVTAKNGSLNSSYEVELVDSSVSTIILSPSYSTKLNYGEQLQMEAFATYSDGITVNITDNPLMNWSTPDAKNAYFSNIKKGLLMTGDAEIFSVTGQFSLLPDKSPSITVEVDDKVPVSIQLTPTQNFSVGLPIQLTTSMVYDDSSTEQLPAETADLFLNVEAWDGEENSTPSISNDGIFYATTAGTVRIKAVKEFANSDLILETTTQDIIIQAPKMTSNLVVYPKEVNLTPSQSQLLSVYRVSVDGSRTLVPPALLSYQFSGPVPLGLDINSNEGKIIAGATEGNTTLIVTDKTLTSEETVDGEIPTESLSVIIHENALESISIKVSDGQKLIPGQKLALSAEGHYEDGSSKLLDTASITWSANFSPESSAYALKDNARLVAVEPGVGNVVATYKAFPNLSSSSYPIEIVNESITSLRISPDIEELVDGFYQTFEAIAVTNTGLDVKLESGQVQWEIKEGSDNVSGAVSMDGSYLVQGTGLGSATIEASIITGAFPEGSILNEKAEDDFKVVESDVNNLIISPLDGESVIINYEYSLKATAIKENGDLIDATNLVIFSSSDEGNSVINNSNKTIMFTQASANQVTITATPNGDSLGNYNSDATSNLTVVKPKVLGIMVLPESAAVKNGETIQLEAWAYYTYDQAPQNVTDSVEWQVVEAVGATVDNGAVTGKDRVGTVHVQAIDDDGNIGQSTISVDFTPKMCGSGVDDTDKNNGSGACIKVASDKSTGNWLTNTPSYNVLERLGYKQIQIADAANDSGKTFLEKNKGYALLVQDGLGVISPPDSLPNGQDYGEMGQFDRYCKHLAEMNFAGRSNWQRPLSFELESFFKHAVSANETNIFDMKTIFGWYIAHDYNAKDQYEDSNYYAGYRFQITGGITAATKNQAISSSCISHTP